MSTINDAVRMAFGGTNGNQTDGSIRPQSGSNSHATPEVITATTSRVFKGPFRVGHFSLDVRVDAVAAPTSATGLTVWYSNCPVPDPTTDLDWVQDTTLGTVLALTAAGKAFVNVGNVFPLYVRLKADVTAGSVSLRAFIKVEGDAG